MSKPDSTIVITKSTTAAAAQSPFIHNNSRPYDNNPICDDGYWQDQNDAGLGHCTYYNKGNDYCNSLYPTQTPKTSQPSSSGFEAMQFSPTPTSIGNVTSFVPTPVIKTTLSPTAGSGIRINQPSQQDLFSPFTTSGGVTRSVTMSIIVPTFLVVSLAVSLT